MGIISTPISAALIFNKRKEIYLVKKEAVLDCLSFLDDYLSVLYFYNDKEKQTITKYVKDDDELTFRARDCFNKLILTCKNEEVIDVFCKLIFPQYYNFDNKAHLSDYHKFRMLCRKELGLKKEPKYNKKDIVFINKV